MDTAYSDCVCALLLYKYAVTVENANLWESLVAAKPATVYGGVLSDHMDCGLEMLAAWNFNEVQGEAQGQKG